MSIHHWSRATRRAHVAVLAAVALLFAGLPAAAHASDGARPAERSQPAASSGPAAPGDPGTISGKVVFPPGYPTSGEVYADAMYWNTTTQEWLLDRFQSVDPTGDGTFEITGLRTGVEHRLRVDIWTDGYLTGYYVGNGKPSVGAVQEAIPVSVPATGIELYPVKAGTVSGTVVVPAGFDWSLGSVNVILCELLPYYPGVCFNNSVQVTEADAGGFSIPKARPGAEHIIQVIDPLERFSRGYYHHGATGLVEDMRDATRLPSDANVTIKIADSYATPTLTMLAAPTINGTAAFGKTLTATNGWWSIAEVVFFHQWLRNGAVIPGATDTEYAPTAADVGAKLSVRVTAARYGFTRVVATSTPTTAVAPAAAPRATVKPTISGTARLGKTLRAKPGTWSVAGAKASYQWLRNGKKIKGATASKYKLTKSDVGKKVSVRVTARVAGHTDGVSTSSAKKVAKGTPKVTVTAKSVKAATRAKVVVKVKAAGLSKPTGTVTVKYGKKTVKVALKSKAKGKVSVRLPKLKKGKYTITVTFKPGSSVKKYIAKATSKKVTLRVK